MNVGIYKDILMCNHSPCCTAKTDVEHDIPMLRVLNSFK